MTYTAPTMYEYLSARAIGDDAVRALWSEANRAPPVETQRDKPSEWVNAPAPNPQRRML